MKMDYVDRRTIEYQENWREWCTKIPTFELRPNYKLCVLPPFGGAMIRYEIFYNDKRFSVYLDVNDSLGSVGYPYWELYNNIDTVRYDFNDHDRLLVDIYIECEGEEIIKGVILSISYK